MEELSRCLVAGSILIHSEKAGPAPDLRAVLLTRLAKYRAHRGLPELDGGDLSLVRVQEETALEALSVVETVQKILDQDVGIHPAPAAAPCEVPAIGTRDISQLRTLLSIIFKWGTEPLLAHIQVVWPARGITRTQVGSKLVDVTDAPTSYGKLAAMTRRLLSLLFPRGVRGTIPQTLISSSLLNRHVTDLLRPGVALGWVPKALSTDSIPVVDDLRPIIMRLMSILPPSQTIASLGAIMSSSPLPPQHVHKSCASLLSQQLMRPDGVRGLLAAVFGESESDEAPLERLLHVSQVLSAIPATVAVEDYFRSIVPRLVELLSPKERVSPAYIRAASFTLSRMTLQMHSSFLTAHPILLITPDVLPSERTLRLPPVEAVQIIQTFLTNTDPAPNLVSTVLSPIATSLYALLGTLVHVRTADPAVRESVRGLLITWGRVVPVDEAVAILWACIDGQGGEWAVELAGSVRRVEKQKIDSSLALFTPEDLKKAEESGALDIDANFLGLRPDPVHFVSFLKSLERPDVASGIFVRLLEGYRDLKVDGDSDPLRVLLFLQMIVQVQTQMSQDGHSPNNILSKPEHILSFIKHALQSDQTQDSVFKRASKKLDGQLGLSMDDLRIVPEERVEDPDTNGDSDDEAPIFEGVQSNEEIIITALNLLLSVLEANPNLSVQSAPALGEIFKDAERLAKAPSESVRTLSREARMVLTVRFASASTITPGPAREPEEDRIHSTYQRALRLLQDPLLPVRAHGLFLLRDLVSTRAGTVPHEVVRALEPAIRDVFLQAIQDNDSYIFLNAVQGLAVLQDVDVRLRVGEALGQVIRRCGDALPRYADILVPPLFALVRGSHLPTTIRTSSLSLLATCADTNNLALIPYANDLANAMLDLLRSKAHHSVKSTDMDSQPTVADPRFPPFRRASLHFLGVLVRAFPSRRAMTTLGYVAATDSDSVVRIMAQEVGEAVRALKRALIGL
ncbi:hypothetical protein B0F90DRAFT_1781194 [Multifurca ochricompacta]|uniref:RNA polymerase II assembly factor Rtp1 C-terminal domain-containing protein n=1 Tax=Multifurca ochricompacta TaxID=376703 RepID=A0AAD4LUP5_9AGAM|nr:hypothetical protein B0F90DRAFT_1781194 [Multifurca ochricompacta]